MTIRRPSNRMREVAVFSCKHWLHNDVYRQLTSPHGILVDSGKDQLRHAKNFVNTKNRSLFGTQHPASQKTDTYAGGVNGSGSRKSPDTALSTTTSVMCLSSIWDDTQRFTRRAVLLNDGNSCSCSLAQRWQAMTGLHTAVMDYTPYCAQQHPAMRDRTTQGYEHPHRDGHKLQ